LPKLTVDANELALIKDVKKMLEGEDVEKADETPA
jgi:hypothetical protein